MIRDEVNQGTNPVVYLLLILRRLLRDGKLTVLEVVLLEDVLLRDSDGKCSATAPIIGT